MTDLTKCPWTDVQPSGKLLRLSEVVTRIGLSRSHIYTLIQQGDFPPLIKIGERASALPEAWLDAFVQSRADDALDKFRGRANG